MRCQKEFALLQSMTGQGSARVARDGISVAVEVRTVNSRYFKLSLRTSDGYASLEPRVDELVRRSIRRGTVQIDVRVEREAAPDQFRLNESVVLGYLKQIRAMATRLQLDDTVGLESLLLLPGVAAENAAALCDGNGCWPVVQEALEKSLQKLAQMRREEGSAMAVDLLENCRIISSELDAIEKRAPCVVDNYRQRLTERINRMLAEHNLAIQPTDMIREVGLFAERSDISEEIVRLRSHIDQFRAIMQAADAEGRKLEFITQEMFREANTIGAKANDAEISCRVIEVKTAIERIREMIQNVE